MHAFVSIVCSSIVVLAASRDAHATAPHHTTQSTNATLAMPMGRSVGSPTSGHIEGGAHLADAPYLRVMPADQAGDVRWGLGALVGMVDRAARHVRHLFSGAVLNVGHLSKNGGGNIAEHASHESGRDADLPFYVKDIHDKEIFADHMVPFRGDGTAPTWPGAHFDDAKNWALVTALLDDPVARVTHIFVSSPIRQRLLAYAARMGAPEALRTRAAFTMVQPHGTLPHDDHFHVRIACPSNMSGCIENPAARIARRAHHHGRAHEVAAHSAPQHASAQIDEHGPEPTRSIDHDVDSEPTSDAPPAAAMVESTDGD
jgi:penicillin-insensitive murein endopeptidase